MQKIVLFDFDGVIADTFDFCHEISKINNPEISQQEYRSYFEGNINDAPSTKKEDLAEFDFFAHYTPRLLAQKPIEGMAEVVQTLAEKYTLIIVSSTISEPIRKFLEINDLSESFDAILGNDIHKSKVKKIEMVFDSFGVEASDCVFITDTLGDLREAAKKNVRAIAVAWGFHPHETLLVGNPLSILSDPNDIITSVNNYFSEN